jgi:integrase
MGLQLYGGGLRLQECLRLRVKDLDFEHLQVTVRDGKGEKDRCTLLPETIVEPLQQHLRTVREAHERALREGYAGVELPYALARKYPNADREWGWQYVYPAPQPSRDRRSGAWRRHHWDPSFMQKAERAALRKLEFTKPAGCHTFRHYADCRIMPTRLRHPRLLTAIPEGPSIADAA